MPKVSRDGVVVVGGVGVGVVVGVFEQQTTALKAIAAKTLHHGNR